MEFSDNFDERLEQMENIRAQEKVRHKRLFRRIISNNKELQGEWQEYFLDSVGGQMLYDGDKDGFLTIEINSKRTWVLIHFFKMVVKKYEDMGVAPEYGTYGVVNLSNEYMGLALKIADCGYNRFKGNHNNLYENNTVTELDIQRQTQMISNYKHPIKSQITGKEGTKNQSLTDTDMVQDALISYLESDFRDVEIDRLLLTLLADSEIVGYIADVGKSKFWGNDAKDPVKKFFFEDGKHPHGKLEREELILSKIKDVNSGRSSLIGFLQYASISGAAVLFSFLLDFIPINFGIGVSVIMFVFWLYSINSSKKGILEISSNREKYFPIITMISKMEDFYFVIRQDSPLSVSSIKKELNILDNAGATMPSGIMVILEDLEERGIKWI